MINLLPPAEKKVLTRERQLRFTIVALCAVFFLELLAGTLLIPSFYTIYTTTHDLTQTLADREKLARSPEGGADVEKKLALIRADIDILRPASSIVEVPPSVLLGEIIEKKPAGIEFKSFSYVRGPKTANLVLSGIAGTQQDLLAFQRDMKAGTRPLEFKYADSFITKKSDIDFSVSISFQ